MKSLEQQDYSTILCQWLKASKRQLYTPPGHPEFEVYGTGYDTWGVQTQQKAFASFAVMAVSPYFDAELAGMSQEEVLEIAIKLLRFNLESHIEGDYYCLDGRSWGHTWISVLGLERMMHGVEAISEKLNDELKGKLEKVLISEANWLLDNYDIVAGLYGGKNKPESNLWNGAFLCRCAMMYPENSRASEYRQKGKRFLVNSISIPEDAEDKADFIGANFHSSYSLNHHGYMNVGYMVICLSNIAMLHFSYRARNLEAPAELYQHAYELWGLIKKCTFPDGRLCRIGGDTRVRYCYCQDYALPAWLFLLDKFGETDCLEFEKGWFDLAVKEQSGNEDKSFLRDRVGFMEELAPLYYTRLESDRAVTMSMAAYWRDKFNEFKDVSAMTDQAPTLGTWHDDCHGACLERSPRRIASWVWAAAEKPQGLCLVPGRSDLAEWKHNFAGEIKGLTGNIYHQLVTHREKIFKGGFLSIGEVEVVSEKNMEGQGKEVLCNKKIAFAALPDDCGAVVIQYARADHRVFLKSVKGMSWKVPNDIYNDGKRIYSGEKSEFVLGRSDVLENVNINSKWLNVDNTLSAMVLYGDKSLTLCRPGKRQIGLAHDDRTGMLYADEICCQVKDSQFSADEGEILLDNAFVVQAGVTAEESRKYAELPVKSWSDKASEIRAIFLSGRDRKKYLFVANFGSETADVSLDCGQEFNAVELDSGKELESTNGKFTCNLEAGEAGLYCVCG